MKSPLSVPAAARAVAGQSQEPSIQATGGRDVLHVLVLNQIL